jgi:hypothetical protein
MDVELSPTVVRGEDGKPAIHEKLFLENVGVSYIDAGGFSVQVEDKRFNRTTVHPIRSDFGNQLGTRVSDLVDEATTETGTRHVSALGRVEDISVHLVNSGSLDSRISTVSHRARVS